VDKSEVYVANGVPSFKSYALRHGLIAFTCQTVIKLAVFGKKATFSDAAPPCTLAQACGK
jgi:hypothetical protein